MGEWIRHFGSGYDVHCTFPFLMPSFRYRLFLFSANVYYFQYAHPVGVLLC